MTDLTPQEMRTLRRIHAAGGQVRGYAGHCSAGDGKRLNMRHVEKFCGRGLLRWIGGFGYELTPAGRLVAGEEQQ